MKRVCWRRPEVEPLVERCNVFIQCVNQQYPHTYPFGCGKRRENGITQEGRSETTAVCLAIDGESAQQYCRYRTWSVATHSARQVGMTDCDCRQGVIAEDRGVVSVTADVAPREVGHVIGQSSIREIRVEGWLAAVKIGKIVARFDRTWW